MASLRGLALLGAGPCFVLREDTEPEPTKSLSLKVAQVSQGHCFRDTLLSSRLARVGGGLGLWSGKVLEHTPPPGPQMTACILGRGRMAGLQIIPHLTDEESKAQNELPMART